MRLALFLGLRPLQRVLIAGLALLAITLTMPIAFAEAVAGADVTPAVSWGLTLVQGVVVPVLLTVATGLTGWLGALLKKKIAVDNELAAAATDAATAALNKTLHASIQRGVQAMETNLRDKLYDEDGKVVVPVKNAGIATVIERTADLMPDTLDRLGVNATTLRRLVTEAVNSRVEGSVLLSGVSAAIAVPAAASTPSIAS